MIWSSELTRWIFPRTCESQTAAGRKPSGSTRAACPHTGTLSGNLDLRETVDGNFDIDVGTGDTLTASGRNQQHRSRRPDKGRCRHADPHRRQHLQRQHHHRLAGTLQIGGAGKLQTGATGFYSGDIAIASGATFQYSSSASNTDARYDGTISGDGTLIKDGSTSILRLQGTTSVANIEINQGTLRVQGNVDALGGAGTTVTIGASGSENAILQYAGSNLTYTTKAAIVVGAGSTGTKTILNGGTNNVENTTITLEDDVIIDDSGTFTLGGVISGTGGLTKTNSGTTTISVTNSYTGNTTVSAGTPAAGWSRLHPGRLDR